MSLFKGIWVAAVGIAEIVCIFSALGVCFNGGSIAEITAGVCSGVVAIYLQHYRESLETPLNLSELKRVFASKENNEEG